MFESDADRLAMIRALGGVVFSAPRGTLEAILNEASAEAALEVGVEGSVPYLECRTSDVERLQLGKGVLLTLGERVLRVVRHRPDGTGMSQLEVSG